MMDTSKTYAGAFDDSDSGYGLVDRYSYAALKDGYTPLWNGMVITKTAAATQQAGAICRGKARLQGVETTTGVPWFVIGLLLMREAGLRNGQLDFGAALHNGERIIGTGRVTKLVPRNKGPFATFEDAANDALAKYKGTTWSPEFIAWVCESFNGFGYRKHGIVTPYLWGGTNRQQRGKYVADGQYDASVMDSQVGCMAILRTVMSMDASASFDREAKRASDVAEQSLPSSGVNQGAAAGGGLTAVGILSMVWDKIQEANEGVLHALEHVAAQPQFWLFVGIACACAYVIWKRKVLRDELRGLVKPKAVAPSIVPEDSNAQVPQSNVVAVKRPRKRRKRPAAKRVQDAHGRDGSQVHSPDSSQASGGLAKPANVVPNGATPIAASPAATGQG